MISKRSNHKAKVMFSATAILMILPVSAFEIALYHKMGEDRSMKEQKRLL